MRKGKGTYFYFTKDKAYSHHWRWKK